MKNLFRFSSPVSSEYADEDSDKDKQFITLNPLNYKEDKIIYNQRLCSGKQIDYYIQYDNLFWNNPAAD